MSSSLASQIVLLLSSVAVGRLFMPSQVGQYAVVVSVATMLTVAVVSTYQKAVPLAETDDEARALTWVSILISVAQGVLLLAALGLAHLLSRDEVFGLGSYLIFIAIIGGVTLSVWSALRSYLLRIGSVVPVGTATVTGNATQGLVQIGAGLLGMGAVGLSWGYVIGRATSSVRMVRRAHLGRPPSWSTLRATESRWRWQSGMLLIPAALTLVTVNATAPLLAVMFGATFAGYWSFAMQFSAVPLALLGQSITSLSLPETAKRLREGRPVQDLTWRLLLSLLLGGMPVFAAMAVLGPEIFSLILGATWREAGVVAAILAPWLAMNIGSAVMSQLAIAQGRYRFIVGLAVIDAFGRIGGLLIGWSQDSAILAVALYSLAGFITSIVWIFWGLKQVDVARHARLRLQVSLTAVLSLVAATAATRQVLPPTAYVSLSVGVVVLLGMVTVHWYLRHLRRQLKQQPAGD